MTPGATFSIGKNSRASILPFPSFGFPSGSITRPRTLSETGIDKMRPVVFTVSPSLIFDASPRITAPTLSSSKLSTTPKTPFGNSSISDA